jgi:hypothetical protein
VQRSCKPRKPSVNNRRADAAARLSYLELAGKADLKALTGDFELCGGGQADGSG